ncbi:pentapeptide repeat-containing protein [Christensenellaceae bacterium NSJ-44]|uniref:Pentapeptide repeat-containing protein n=2 Tax=Luoshenia tenuis TaxID=2763654 RepID=A0A926HM57_9FIRM|nr:pentapeptide repeat-containing protein [Luoshenia tenuis]
MKRLTQEQLNSMIAAHAKWLAEDSDGARLDLSDCDMRGADMRWADMCLADMRGADMRWADMCLADMRGADMCGANIDYSVWPLWCGSLGVKVDKRLAAQLAYHFCRLICDDPEVKTAQRAIAGLANQFHRVNECGRINCND